MIDTPSGPQRAAHSALMGRLLASSRDAPSAYWKAPQRAYGAA
jgi:hypothetical protein